jgi:cytidylate kinase
MIITISGAGGSGKSTIAKRLAEKLGWPRYYIGGIRREKAKERGMTLAEYNKLGETDPSTDIEVDEYQKKLGEREDDFIIEGRTSWHFIPNSFKVYLDVDEKEGAKRVFNELQGEHKRNEDKALDNYENVLESMRERKKCDIKRYKKYYNINAYDIKNYDYVLDTTNLSINKVFQAVDRAVQTEIDKNGKLV